MVAAAARWRQQQRVARWQRDGGRHGRGNHCHPHAATVCHRSGDGDTGSNRNGKGTDDNQQSTKSSNGNGNGNENGNDDSNNDDNRNEGNGGGGSAGAAQRQRRQLGRSATLAAVAAHWEAQQQLEQPKAKDSSFGLLAGIKN